MKTLCYILMTRCGKCKKLKPLDSEAIKMQPSTEYVLAVSDKDVLHPATGKKTLGANEPFLLKPDEQVMRYGCPRNPELTFIVELNFAEQCPDFEKSQ